MTSIKDELGPWPSKPIESFEDVTAALREVDEAMTVISVALGIAFGPQFLHAMVDAANLVGAAEAEAAAEDAEAEESDEG